ncbi:amino acid adenylation domain-containing protein [Candidatus Magnetominusculus dajiuhuensis]|uniref:amino acid adenylation domain-containing protein n=1 Tax=Candidatus Magnetominusculus dajiuhuensis TaxID=3137712 RepID=UPI0019DFE7F8|nr:amino acid adenylation domain-containing protein [Nitrospirota bacterium]
MNFNLSRAVYRHSIDNQGSLAVASDSRELTYGQFASGARAISACLRTSPSFVWRDGQPPRVGILASRSVEAALGVMGAAWAGATYVPIGPKLPEDRILTILSLCNLSALIVGPEGVKQMTDKVLSACPPLIIVPGAAQFQAKGLPGIKFHDAGQLPDALHEEPANVEGSSISYILFTSGTTGVPKGVAISAAAVANYVEAATAMLEMRPSDRTIELTELTFDVSVSNMFCTWEAGASLHVLPAVRVMSAVKFARQRHLTVWSSVPSLIDRLRQIKALTPGALPGIRLSVFMGEPLTESLVTAWMDATPNSVIVNQYGPTETTIANTICRISQPIPLTPGRDYCPLGKPWAGNELAIVNANGAFLPTGTTGELALSGVQLSSGYLNQPELNAARFPIIDGKRWYLSGDLAMQDSSGTFHLLGRIDNQVKVMGNRVELEEVDTHLRTVANTGIAAAVTWPIVDGIVQGLVGFVGAKQIDQLQIIAAMKDKLPAYMVPSRVLALENMPFNSNGKVDRNALRQLLQSGEI